MELAGSVSTGREMAAIFWQRSREMSSIEMSSCLHAAQEIPAPVRGLQACCPPLCSAADPSKPAAPVRTHGAGHGHKLGLLVSGTAGKQSSWLLVKTRKFDGCPSQKENHPKQFCSVICQALLDCAGPQQQQEESKIWLEMVGK